MGPGSRPEPGWSRPRSAERTARSRRPLTALAAAEGVDVAGLGSTCRDHQREHGDRGDEERAAGRVGQEVLRELGKVRSYAATRSGPSASRVVPRFSAAHSPVTRTHSGWLRERGAPGGDRNGESVSISSRSAGTAATASADASSPLPEDEPREADGQAEIDDLVGVVERPRVRVDDGGWALPERRCPGWPADTRRAQLRDERVLRVAPAVSRAAMEDGGLAGLERERQVPPQVGQLVRDRAEDTVVVEAGLADRHDPRIRCPADDPRPAGVIDLGRVVGMDPDRGVEPREAVDAAERPLRRRDVPTGDQDALEPGQPRRPDDLVGVSLEPIGVEVAVGVDEPASGERSTRRTRHRAAGRGARAP